MASMEPRSAGSKRPNHAAAVGITDSDAGSGGGARSKLPKTEAYTASSIYPLHLLSLEEDTVSEAFSFLDLKMLLRLEVTGKCLKPSLTKTWALAEALLDKNKADDKEFVKANGSTARGRVVRSSEKYQLHILSNYAKKVELMTPEPGAEKLHRAYLLDKSATLDDFKYYVRFAVRNDDKSNSKMLAGGVFPILTIPMVNNDADFADINNRLRFGRTQSRQSRYLMLDLRGIDISEWPKMDQFLNPSDYSFMDNLLITVDASPLEALRKVDATVVAMNKKNLSTCVVMASDDNMHNGGMYFDTFITHTQGSMYVDNWDNERPEEESHSVDYIFAERSSSGNGLMVLEVSVIPG